MTCPDVVDLERYHSDEFAPDDAERIRRHLEECPNCREHLAHIEANNAIAGDLRRVARASAPPHPPAPMATLTQGQTVGEYRVVREISRTVTSVVLEAVHPGIGQRVALKVLADWAVSDPRRRQRFEREVAMQAQLLHPNIVPVYDSGLASGQYFLVTPYLEAIAADEYVDHHAPPLRERVRLLRDIAHAIAFAHRRGVLHRDVKPSNVLVDGDGTPYVLDFGLGKLLREGADDGLPTLTIEPGMIMGTPAFMSPEQAEGRNADVDVRSDIYAVGVLAYRLLTGRMPYPPDGGLAQILQHVVATTPPPPSRHRREIDRDLDRLVLRALTKEPEQRYQSAGEMAEDLDRYLEGRPLRARDPSLWYLLRCASRRHARGLAVAGLVLVAAVGAVSWSLVRAADRLEAAELSFHADLELESLRYYDHDRRLELIEDTLRQVERAIQLDPGRPDVYMLRGRLRAAKIPYLAPSLRVQALREVVDDFEQTHTMLLPDGAPQALWEAVRVLNENFFFGARSTTRLEFTETPKDAFKAFNDRRGQLLETLMEGPDERFAALARKLVGAHSVRRSAGEPVGLGEGFAPALVHLLNAANATRPNGDPSAGADHRGDLDTAEGHVRRALEVDPENPDAWRMAATIARLAGKPDEAVEHAWTARELFPESYEVLRELAFSLEDAGDLAGAVTVLRDLVRMFPDESQAHNYLARAYVRCRDFAAAEDAAWDAIDRNAENSFAWSNLHLSLWKADRFEEAEALHRQRRTEADALQYGVEMNQAEAYYAQGRYQEALEIYEYIRGRMLQMTGYEMSQLWSLNHALTLKALGRHEEAHSALVARGEDKHAFVCASVLCEFIASEVPAMRDAAGAQAAASSIEDFHYRDPFVEAMLALAALREGGTDDVTGDLRASRGVEGDLWAQVVLALDGDTGALDRALELAGDEPQDPRLVGLFAEAAEALGRSERLRAAAHAPLCELPL